MSDSLAPALVLGKVVEVESSVSNYRVRLQRFDMPDGVETDWLAVLTPMAGESAGLLFTPEVDDVAVVAFAGLRAIVLGFLYGGGVTPPTSKPEERIIQSRDGNALILIDGDSAGITIKDKNDNTITMDSNGITIKTSGDLTIEASGTTTIKGATVELNP